MIVQVRINQVETLLSVFLFFLSIFPVEWILPFQPPGLGSYLIRATASYSFAGLVVAAFYCNVSWLPKDVKLVHKKFYIKKSIDHNEFGNDPKPFYAIPCNDIIAWY